MPGGHEGRRKACQGIHGFGDSFFRRFHKVQAADHALDVLSVRSGVPKDVDDPGVAAARDDHDSLSLDPCREGQVVRHLVRDHTPVFVQRGEGDAHFLEIRHPGDFPGCRESRHELERGRNGDEPGPGCDEILGEIALHDAHVAEKRGRDEIQAKQGGVEDDGQILLADGFQDLSQPLGMVVVAMCQYDRIGPVEGDTEFPDIVEKGVGVLPNVHQDPHGNLVTFRLEPVRYPVLSEKRAFVGDAVFCQYRDCQLVQHHSHPQIGLMKSLKGVLCIKPGLSR